MLMMQPNKYPDTPYNKYMKTSRVNLYTFWQMVFFSGVFLVQNTKSIALGFPFMTLLCLPGRLMTRINTTPPKEKARGQSPRANVRTWLSATKFVHHPKSHSGGSAQCPPFLAW